MKRSWTQGLEPERTRDIKSNFKEALVMRQRLIEMLNAKIERSSKYGRSKETYENANWALLQADSRGYERAMQEIIDLIDENVKED